MLVPITHCEKLGGGSIPSRRLFERVGSKTYPNRVERRVLLSQREREHIHEICC